MPQSAETTINFQTRLEVAKTALDEFGGGVTIKEVCSVLKVAYGIGRVVMEALVDRKQAFKCRVGKQAFYFSSEAECLKASMNKVYTRELTKSLIEIRQSSFNMMYPPGFTRKKELKVLPRNADVVYPENVKVTICPSFRDTRYEVTEPIRGGFHDEWLEKTGQRVEEKKAA